jgi:hypothetical protein
MCEGRESGKYVLLLLVVVFSLAVEALARLFNAGLAAALVASLLTALVAARAAIAGRLNALVVAVRSTACVLLTTRVLLAASAIRILGLLVGGFSVALSVVAGALLVVAGLRVRLGVRAIVTVLLFLLALLLIFSKCTPKKRPTDATDKASNKTTKSATADGLTGELSGLIADFLGSGIASLLVTKREVAGHTNRLAASVAGVLGTILVVQALLDAFAAKLPDELTLTIPLAFPPLPDSVEHDVAALLYAAVLVPKLRGMMEDSLDNDVDGLLRVGLAVPASNDLRDCPLEDLGRNPSSGLVQQIAEVILWKHAVGRVGALIVAEDNVLLLARAGDDLAGTSLELGLDLSDDGHDERSQQAENEDVDLLL